MLVMKGLPGQALEGSSGGREEGRADNVAFELSHGERAGREGSRMTGRGREQRLVGMGLEFGIDWSTWGGGGGGEEGQATAGSESGWKSVDFGWCTLGNLRGISYY